MTARLSGRVIVVTGATGIAGASAQRLAEEGASVFTVSRTDDHCVALNESILAGGGVHDWATADLRDEDATVQAFDACVDRFGRVDGLLSVAGGSGRRFGDGHLDTISLDAWHATLDLNLTTTFLSVREAVRRMLVGAGGSIAIVSSVLADHPSPSLFGTHAYAVAKGGQLALVRTAAAAYAGSSIRVNGIAPAIVVTPMSQRAQGDEAVAAYVDVKQPLSGFMEPGPVAAAAAYLLSSEGDMITGQVLGVDGGWSVTEVGG
jgi:NAD(P)-dependent dehydrogenase (short-subunit alcohol dehydrogenase family)